jgi:hypothetical protein
MILTIPQYSRKLPGGGTEPFPIDGVHIIKIATSLVTATHALLQHDLENPQKIWDLL